MLQGKQIVLDPHVEPVINTDFEFSRLIHVFISPTSLSTNKCKHLNKDFIDRW